MVRVWHMEDDANVVSQFSENYVGDYDLDTLANSLGVTYHKVNVDDLNDDDSFKVLKSKMGITYQDSIVISPEKFPNYKEKIFYDEHLHADDEIRLVLDGSGYFDVRDDQDKWIRIHVEKGDLLTLPAGIYHRFTNNDKHYIHAMRLFVGDPVWTPINRPADEHESRLHYLKHYQNQYSAVCTH